MLKRTNQDEVILNDEISKERRKFISKKLREFKKDKSRKKSIPMLSIRNKSTYFYRSLCKSKTTKISWWFDYRIGAGYM